MAVIVHILILVCRKEPILAIVYELPYLCTPFAESHQLEI